MDVILLERVEKLGNIGDVVAVKPGFARNFLLPRHKALRASEANRKRFEANRSTIEADNAHKRELAVEDSAAIDGKTIILIRQASNTGQLYGSVATRDLADALTADGMKVTRAQIILDKPIKALGMHTVKVSLHPEVSVDIKVNIARSPEEAELQAKGVDVTADMFERDDAGFTEAYDPNAEPGTIPTDEPVAEAAAPVAAEDDNA
jgi:large subunit ribosomal protein L9